MKINDDNTMTFTAKEIIFICNTMQMGMPPNIPGLKVANDAIDRLFDAVAVVSAIAMDVDEHETVAEALPKMFV